MKLVWKLILSPEAAFKGDHAKAKQYLQCAVSEMVMQTRQYFSYKRNYFHT